MNAMYISTSVFINDEVHPRVHLATNFTGLYKHPTFDMPLSNELQYGIMLEVFEEDGN